MIKLPKFEQAFEHENNFFLSCDNARIGRILARYELYKMAKDVPGVIIECGVFKGVSLMQLTAIRDFFGASSTRKIVCFDSFTNFPEVKNELDRASVKKFVDSAGSECISVDQLKEVLDKKGLNRNIEFVAGDILETVPKYVKEHQELKISLLFLDTDTYETAAVILKHMYDRLAPGGILVLDDYGRVPGETKAVDEFLSAPERKGKVTLVKSPFCYASSYLVKEA